MMKIIWKKIKNLFSSYTVLPYNYKDYDGPTLGTINEYMRVRLRIRENRLLEYEKLGSIEEINNVFTKIERIITENNIKYIDSEEDIESYYGI